MREGIVAGLTSRNYHRAVESVLDGYGIEKSSVSREFVAASAAQLRKLCERKLDGLDLAAILIDGIHLGQQVLVVALASLENQGSVHSNDAAPNLPDRFALSFLALNPSIYPLLRGATRARMSVARTS